MNGIKLKSDQISPIKMERIKWVCILLFSHLLMAFLDFNTPEIIQKDHMSPRSGHTRLQLQIKSKVPILNKETKIILLTKDLDLVSRQAILLKKIDLNNSIDNTKDSYLVDIPESDLNNLIKYRKKGLIAYPSSKKILTNKSKQRKTNYEIYF